MAMEPRKFTYFFFGSLDPAAAGSESDPRSYLTPAADGLLTDVINAGPSRFGYREACERYSPALTDGLVRSGLFRVEDGALLLDSTVLLREDLPALSGFFQKEIPPLAARLEAAMPALYAAIRPLDNGFDEKVNLYHLLCGAVLDGRFFDYLSGLGLAADSRLHPSGLDYLIVVYEDCPALNRFSNRLLCSYNRLSDGKRALQSFGDADGERVDFYRFLSQKRKGRVPAALKRIEADWDAIEGEAVTARILDALQRFDETGDCPEAFRRLFADFGYISGGRYLVPVYRQGTEAVVERLFGIAEDCVGGEIGRLLDGTELYSRLRCFAHGVPKREIANEAYHILFGLLNEEMAARGMVHNPVYRPGEGRYLQSIELL